MSLIYIQETYGVPAVVGRRVTVYGKPGVIVGPINQYIGVLFDADKPGNVRPAHPVDGVVYGEMGEIRPMSRSQARYQRYLRVSECFEDFMSFCRWDARKECA